MENLRSWVSNSQRKTGSKSYKKIETEFLVVQETIQRKPVAKKTMNSHLGSIKKLSLILLCLL